MDGYSVIGTEIFQFAMDLNGDVFSGLRFSSCFESDKGIFSVLIVFLGERGAVED